MIYIGLKKLSNEEEKRLVEEYIEGASVSALMKKYGFKSKKSITDKVKKYYPDAYSDLLKKAKNNRKNYSIDLSEINCEFNAYFLGLMLTDGYVQDKNKFGIQLTDEDCIKFISDVTGKEYKEYPAPEEKGKLNQYRIIFSEENQVKIMRRFGIISNKTLTLQPPKLTIEEEKYIPYIIRGMIDGDGCVYKTSEGSAAFYISTMSHDFAVWTKEILEEKLFMKDISLNQGNDDIWLVETALQSNIYKLIALVYDKPYGMSRKYLKIRETFRDYNLGNQDFMLD